MQIIISSFAFRRGTPGADAVLDARKVRNPGKEAGKKTALNKKVANLVFKDPKAHALVTKGVDIVLATLKAQKINLNFGVDNHSHAKYSPPTQQLAASNNNPGDPSSPILKKDSVKEPLENHSHLPEGEPDPRESNTSVDTEASKRDSFGESSKLLEDGENCSTFHLGVGCLAGKHRSVAIAQAIALQLHTRGINCTIVHREIEVLSKLD